MPLSLSAQNLMQKEERNTRFDSKNRYFSPLDIKQYITSGVFFQVLKKWSSPNIIWFWIHNDEYDARENTLWAYKTLGGTALMLNNQSNRLRRNLSFFIKNKGRFYLDPNRMFQLVGVRNNLRLLNKSKYLNSNKSPVISYAWKIGKKARSTLLQYWNKNTPLIALHNNRYLTIDSYKKNRSYYITADFTKNHNATFVFVTQKDHFNKLKNCKINVIYQYKSSGDGSLSDFSINNQLPYINIETKINHGDEQRNVLLKILSLLYKDKFNHPLINAQQC